MLKIATGLLIFIACLLPALLLGGCQASGAADNAPQAGTQAGAAASQPTVLAVESFLADMAQNVAGDRLTIDTLMPLGLDPHAFEPAPRDIARIADADVLIVNGAGFEEWLAEVLDNAGGEQLVIEVSAGLPSREEHIDDPGSNPGSEAAADHEEHGHTTDPHFWLDPTLAVHYVAAIRDGLAEIDPAGQAIYAANAAAYSAQLNELDGWIATQIEQIPPEQRLLVTNHESLGYYADRYGLRLIGAVTPSSSSSAAPSAQQLAQLADLIRSSGAAAIFLETGANTQLAEQLHAETGVTVVADLHTHSVTAADGAAPTYIEMMRANTRAIVDTLR